ncbi:polysaccharide biosynthesis protein [Photobacterium sanguinicancri]|uniref:polysaccharide biosynthesis protein n=1 Tax=Photobacterium sanguinicancri TaxID=875932 RepID=UPI0024817B02|nr:nucleoside-diphosphate sugar epimerase/dehydratase [Photobacterium sanguinicancri]
MKHLNSFWDMSRIKKRLISIILDSVFIVLSFYLAFWARLGEVSPLSDPLNQYLVVITLFVTLIAFTKLGLYRAVLRYLTFHALAVISIGTIISASTVGLLAYFIDSFVPRSVPLIYGSFLCILCGGARLFVRVLITQLTVKGKAKVLIYGTGTAGRQLALALRSSDDYRVISFLDEDKTLENTMILGLKVHNIDEASRLITRYGISKILLAIPSASNARRKLILDQLVSMPAEVLTVPAMADIVSGKAQIDQLRDVPIEDLLGRDPVEPQQSLLEANIKDKVVMVTGAGGSIGSELCRQILKQHPKVLVLFELSEFGLYQVDRELNQLKAEFGISIPIIPLLGSVQRPHRLVTAMKSYSVDTVYHAAAYKHVPLVEYNVIEGVRNNIYGTYFTAKAAIEANVESFVLISTDKAVRPTNVMGTTKRMAELGLQALAKMENLREGGTRFCMVRFGNVLGSSGSVIPLFKKQIAAGGPLTVTHPDITRYFMTIPEAAQLVIQAGAMGKGGDVFVLDMGESVKITDLAENLIKLSGLEVKNDLNPHGDIEIKFTGLRPGEKLYEELLIGDNVSSTAHSRIMTANEICLSLAEYEALLSELDKACHGMEHEHIRALLLEAPTGFKPTDGIGDLIWNMQDKLNHDSN